TRSGHNRGWFSRLHFGFDAGQPFQIATFEQPLRDAGICLAQPGIGRGKGSDISSFPCGPRLIEEIVDSLAAREGVEQEILAIALEHLAPKRDVLIDRLQPRHFLSPSLSLRDEIEVHTARAAGAGKSLRCEESQRDCPWPVLLHVIE